MTDDKLADEIERICARTSAGERVELSVGDCYQIIAALRRQPSGDNVLVPRAELLTMASDCAANRWKNVEDRVMNLLTFAAAEAEEGKT